MAENVLEVLKALRDSNPLDGNDVEVVAEATGIHYACDRLEPLIEELIESLTEATKSGIS